MSDNVSKSNNRSYLKLLQITDTHLFSGEAEDLLGVDTLKSFTAVVSKILEGPIDFDAILATGDISQDQSATSYLKFIKGIEPLRQPCFWLPGNHDYSPTMTYIALNSQVSSSPHFLAGDVWQVIILDSQFEGAPHGYLRYEELALLDDRLTKHVDRHTLILLHHHPILVGSAWLDQHALKRRAYFWKIISHHDNVRAVLCGHVHQEIVKYINNTTFISTPSTCIQFKRCSDDFAVDFLPPGWRELYLHDDGTLTTEVKRLPDGQFLPDFYSNGY